MNTFKPVNATPNCSPDTHGILVYRADPTKIYEFELLAVPLNEPGFRTNEGYFGDYSAVQINEFAKPK